MSALILALATLKAVSVRTILCPASLPRFACLGGSESALNPHALLRAQLPLNDTLEYVRELLQDAIEVEHSTIPLYLTALYSMKNQTSFEAATVKSVVVEEMLHMVHAANVLNAIGGSPDIDHPDFVPKYPLNIPLINVSADIVWFSQSSAAHFHVIESTPPQGFNMSISYHYQHIVALLTSLCHNHGEHNVFTGNASLQVEAFASGETAGKVASLQDATDALLGVAEQGGGCPVAGKSWPQVSNISAGPLGGEFSHSIRFDELLQGRQYAANDSVGKPSGPPIDVAWSQVRRFTPNPSKWDFYPEQCVEGGNWIRRNDSFFVSRTWVQERRSIDMFYAPTWEECAQKCAEWTVQSDRPMEPCAMWSWRDVYDPSIDPSVSEKTCLLSQGGVYGGPVTKKVPGFVSGCLYDGIICNKTLPLNPPSHSGGQAVLQTVPDGLLQGTCEQVGEKSLYFASNYTAMLVGLHNVFNGQPDALPGTLGQMYALKALAIDLMQTADPRFPNQTVGVGPLWEYVPNASEYEARGRRPR